MRRLSQTADRRPHGNCGHRRPLRVAAFYMELPTVPMSRLVISKGLILVSQQTSPDVGQVCLGEVNGSGLAAQFNVNLATGRRRD